MVAIVIYGLVDERCAGESVQGCREAKWHNLYMTFGVRVWHAVGETRVSEECR